MSSEYEEMLRKGFSGLGSYSKLSNGFRLRAPSGQTCAVYFSGNASGNAVEISLAPKVLAPLLGRTERELAEWLGRHDAARRERTRSGMRGSYPVGLAFKSHSDLEAFIVAWDDFRRGDGGTSTAKDAAPGALVATRIEKAAQDAGFDHTPARDGNWLVCRSSAFPHWLGVVAQVGDEYRVGFSDAVWGKKVAQDCGAQAWPEAEQWPAVVDPVGSYEDLHAMLQRAGRLAHLLAGEAASKFAGEAECLRATTEAERLVVQRVGQETFRRSLIDYWQGRCAVTGLDVVALLRASHIKPWVQCATDAERLDVFNGLLLAPHLDALFDGGWISFDDKGDLLVCSQLSPDQQRLLGVQPMWRVAELAEAHRNYLIWHRREVFRR
ncbi:HNH endonuclease [Candidatus Accumulibacter sp. ACC003]|uniref:HNH endonuclease n=1 Tax=Candidatus Accumulibacter sp. ACC003 TaxID=2823334 RepID=UPI0025C590AB|nr:HNH endonuclease [Candidatus Accumulibacter sp. ACC003]